jgi:hypothetical protein
MYRQETDRSPAHLDVLYKWFNGIPAVYSKDPKRFVKKDFLNKEIRSDGDPNEIFFHEAVKNFRRFAGPDATVTLVVPALTQTRLGYLPSPLYHRAFGAQVAIENAAARLIRDTFPPNQWTGVHGGVENNAVYFGFHEMLEGVLWRSVLSVQV